jgi:methylmalonyl-CoA carboxyltransferase 5S subunit
MPRTVEFTDLLLREAQQSLLETSIALADVAPVCEDLDNAGYWSVDCWGGTAFNSCVRFLNERRILHHFCPTAFRSRRE